MAAILLNQSDTSESYNAGSSGATAGIVVGGRRMEDGGPLGSTEISPLLRVGTGPDLDRGCLTFLSTVIPEETWDSGDYVPRLNCTFARELLLLEEIYIDELQDDGTTYVNIVNEIAIQVEFAATGVVSRTLNRATDFMPKNTSSKLSITFVFQSDVEIGAETFSFTPDQVIDTPIENTSDPGSSEEGEVFDRDRMFPVTPEDSFLFVWRVTRSPNPPS